MTSRTQITLDSETQRRAKSRAANLGLSFAEYVRRLVAKDLEGPSPTRSPSLVFDLGESTGSDIHQEKDRMLAEAFNERRPKRCR